MHPTVSKLQLILVIVVATACVSAGETLLSAGMKQVGRSGAEGFRFVLTAASNRHVLCGVALMATFFALYSLCLSWADISFVLPFTALSYLFVAVMARFLLHEQVTLTRVIGTLIIVIGVIVVAFGERGSIRTDSERPGPVVGASIAPSADRRR